MRTSSQLTRTSGCSNGSDVNLTSISPNMLRASAVRNITKRMLLGEPIPDIKSEIHSLLSSRRYTWENNTQRDENFAKYERAIKDFIQVESERDHIYLDGVNTVVDVFGEEIEAKPDFIVEYDDYVMVSKISTGKGTPVFQTDNMEDYALGLLGKKLYPNKDVFVEHIGMNINSYNVDKDGTQINSLNGQFNQDVELMYERIDEANKTEGHVCSEAACSSCPKNNICNYKEPPVAMEVRDQVRPVADIHLTNAQRQIVEYEQGVARVNAGPGAGKTLVVALRVASLLEKGYQPEDFALLTFTKAGAEEMTARVMSYAAEKGIALDPERFCSGTINGFCQDIIKEHYEELGFSRIPRIVPDEIRLATIQNIIGNELPRISAWNYSSFHSDKKFNPWIKDLALTQAATCFQRIKKEHYTREDNPFQLNEADTNTLFLAYEMYEAELRSRNMIEYDDQLQLVNQLLEMNPDLFAEYGFKHIIVDEFQDTDYDQIQLINKIMDTRDFKSFMAVGDDSQSIFSFRFTSPEFMINFENYFGRFDDFELVDNHRSNKATIDFANKLNEQATNRVEKELKPTKEEGVKPIARGMYTEKEECEYITNDIKRRWEAGERDIAVMGRTNKELRTFANYLTKAGIPSIIMGQIPVMENSRVAALISFYDSYFNGTSQGFADYQNVMESGAYRNMSSEAIELSVENFKEDLQETPRNLKTFMEFANKLDENKTDACYQDFLSKFEFCETTAELREFVDAFKLYGLDSQFKREGQYEGVTLTTVHNAKGLEWDTTYLSLTGFDRKAKHTRQYEHSNERDEDIRMFFVGATRARKELIMTSQYLAQKPTARTTPIPNQFLQMAYQLTGRAWGYNYNAYQATVTKEKSEAMEEAIKNTAAKLEDMKVRTLKDVQRDAKKREKEIAAAAKKAEKELKKAKKQTDKKSEPKVREMTEEEIAEYERITKNSEQITLE